MPHKEHNHSYMNKIHAIVNSCQNMKNCATKKFVHDSYNLKNVNTKHTVLLFLPPFPVAQIKIMTQTAKDQIGLKKPLNIAPSNTYFLSISVSSVW